jgi:hypothetical protein
MLELSFSDAAFSDALAVIADELTPHLVTS